jgi:predicted Zn-dependent peptidase
MSPNRNRNRTPQGHRGCFRAGAALDIVYKIPPGNTPDWYALSVLGQVLSGGVSSRLLSEADKDKEVALSASLGRMSGAALRFWFSIAARPGPIWQRLRN